MHKLLLMSAVFTVLLTACFSEGGTWGPVFPKENPIPPCDTSDYSPPFDRFRIKGSFGDVPVSDGSRYLLVAGDTVFWYDFRTGKLLHRFTSWKAREAFEYGKSIYQSDHFALAASRTTLAAFDFQTGQLAWDRSFNNNLARMVAGLRDHYFIVQKNTAADGVSFHAVYMGNLQHPEDLQLLATPLYSRIATNDWAGYGQINALAPFTGADGHDYLLIKFFEPLPGTYAVANFLGLFDISTQTWIYERQPIAGDMHSPVAEFSPVIVTENIACFNLDNKLIDWDLSTGSVLDSFVLFRPSTAYPNSTLEALRLWTNERYAVVQTNMATVEVFDRINHRQLYHIERVANPVYVDLEANRLFINYKDYINVHELTSGGNKALLLAPCPLFLYDMTTWKDSVNTLHFAVETGDVNIYHYRLPN